MFSARVAWALALGCVAWQVVVRTGWLFDIAGRNGAPVPLIVVGALVIVGLVAAQVFISTERGPQRPLLVAMVTLTFAPAPLLGNMWPDVTGLVGSAILLTVRTPWSWPLAGLVLGADALVYGVFSESSGAQISGRVLVHANVTLTLFVVVRLARLIQQTHGARHAAAQALVEVEKQRSAQWLRSALAPPLGELIAMTGHRSAGTALARDDVTRVAQTARRAAEMARRAVDTQSRTSLSRQNEAETEPPDDHAVSWAVSVILTLTFAAVATANLFWQGGATGAVWGITIAVAVSAGALHLYHGTSRRDGGSPRWWPWTLAAQAVIVALGVWVAGAAVLLPYSGLVAGGAATRLRTPWLWLLPPATFILGPVLAAALAPSWNGWASVFMIGSLATVMIALYALCHLPWVARLLRETQAEFARVAAVAERSSFARDVHDLLGLHLSAMVLNAELAARALDQDIGIARARLATVRRCAERAMFDLQSIHGRASPTTAGREIVDAASLLRAAGMQVTVDIPEDSSGRADHIAAIVVREASTNVLRHAGSGHCSFRLRVGRGGDLQLDIFNDSAKVAGAQGTGTGIGNLTARVEEAGGQLTTTRTEGTFRLTAHIPAHPPAAPQEPVSSGTEHVRITF